MLTSKVSSYYILAFPGRGRIYQELSSTYGSPLSFQNKNMLHECRAYNKIHERKQKIDEQKKIDERKKIVEQIKKNRPAKYFALSIISFNML